MVSLSKRDLIIALFIIIFSLLYMYLCIGLYMCKYVSSIYIMVYVQRENAKKMSHLKTFFDKTSWLIILSKKADEKIMMTSFLSISASTFLLCINRVMAHHWWGWGRGRGRVIKGVQETPILGFQVSKSLKLWNISYFLYLNSFL